MSAPETLAAPPPGGPSPAAHTGLAAPPPPEPDAASEPADTPGQAPAERHHNAQEVLDSPAFKALVARRWTVSFVSLALLFASYYGYILLIATSKAFVSQKVGEVTTLAIPLGIAAIVVAWALTAAYVAWANRSYDPEVERIKATLRRSPRPPTAGGSAP